MQKRESPLFKTFFSKNNKTYSLVFLILCLAFLGGCGSDNSQVSEEEGSEVIADSIHAETGLVLGEGFDIVRATCTACHSANLVTQNRATREGWEEMIRWMQASQGLWDLGENESLILDYLAEHYGIDQEAGRRPGLDMSAIDWYDLDLEGK